MRTRAAFQVFWCEEAQSIQDMQEVQKRSEQGHAGSSCYDEGAYISMSEKRMNLNSHLKNVFLSKKVSFKRMHQ